MRLAGIDFLMIGLFFAVLVLIGVLTSRRAGKSSLEFFLSGRSMPWWLLGVSMLAATTSTNSANLFTEIIRKKGIAGNWVWWAFLLTGLLTVFVYAKLWHRTGATTDNEFYELRYSGKIAAILRCFRSLYLGVIFNTIITALVLLGAIKIGVVVFNLSPWWIVGLTAVSSILYSALGGIRGMVLTDLFMFILVMVGAVMMMVYALGLPEVGGLAKLMSHPVVASKLSFFPDWNDTDLMLEVFLIPVAIQWWNVWYPGSEPGGGGYIVQRMLSAKNEKHSLGSSLFHNVVHYAIRPWPWYIVALASLIVFPDLASLQKAFPNVTPDILNDDLAYPAMLIFLPPGAMGIVVASLLGALLSTVAAHLNWGASYVVNDFYHRFINPDATEKQLVMAGRVSIVVLMILSCLLSPLLQSAKTAFDLVLQIGAGTGLIFLLRWFWWRINAYSELTAMAVSFLVAIFFTLVWPLAGWTPLPAWQKLILGIVITTIAWVTVTFLTKPDSDEKLISFCRLVRPGGPGWREIERRAAAKGEPILQEKGWDVPRGLLCMTVASFAVYAGMFATGDWIYGRYTRASVLTVLTAIACLILFRIMPSLLDSGTKSAKE